VSPCDEKRVDVAWNNDLGKSSMRIGTKLSTRCSIIVLAFLYPSC